MTPSRQLSQFAFEEVDSVSGSGWNSLLVDSVSGSGWNSSLSNDLDYSEHQKKKTHHSEEEENVGSDYLKHDANRDFTIDQEADESLSEYAARLCHEKIKRMPNTAEVDDAKYMAPFTMEEITIGDFLGKGEFSNVFQIDSFALKNHLSEKGPEKGKLSDDAEKYSPRFTVEQNQGRKFLKANAIRSTGKKRYAIKHLLPGLEESNPKKFLSAAQDLALEAYFLKRFEHPHIMKMRGFAASGTDGFATGGHNGFYLILDCLSETLQARITRWSKEKKESKRLVNKIWKSKDSSIKQVALLDRLKIADNLASAMTYLHKLNIIYRDLKPANVGFDIRGDIKLFDFGLAKQLPPSKDMNEDTFRMSHAGSLRYMAPEVIMYTDYNLKADVYSFSILLWELLALKKPYKGLDADSFVKNVIEKQKRPRLDKSWPRPINDMFEMCFDQDFRERPPMMLVQNILRFQIEGIEGSLDPLSKKTNNNSSRRRSLGSIGTVGTSFRRRENVRDSLCKRNSDPFF